MRYTYRVSHSRFGRIPRELRQRVGAVVRKTAFDVQAGMVSSMQGGGSGEWYGSHQASAPGEPPARDTGTLANSIQAVRLTELHWQVVVAADYGAHLEFGTVFMEPRPFAEPTAERLDPGFRADVALALKGLEG